MPGPQRSLLRSGVRVGLAGARQEAARGAPQGALGPASLAAVLNLATGAEDAEVGGFFVSRAAGVDPYVVLGAVASVTARVALGCLAAPAGERPPAILAKLVTTLDVVSGGRAVLCLAPSSRATDVLGEGGGGHPDGAHPDRASVPRGGGHPNGARVPAGGLRRADPELADALEICRAMVRVPGPSYAGDTAGIVGAWNEPRFDELGPMQVALLVPRRAPVREVGSSPPSAFAPVPALLHLAARFAEICLLEVGSSDPRTPLVEVAGAPGPAQATGEELRRVFDSACFESGRLPDEVALVAVCSIGEALSSGGGAAGVAEVVCRSRSWRRSGYDGVVLDVGPGDLGDERLGDLLGAIASLDP